MQACAICTQLLLVQDFTARSTVLVQEAEQRKFAGEDFLQAGQVTLTQGLVFGIDQLKPLRRANEAKASAQKAKDDAIDI